MRKGLIVCLMMVFLLSLSGCQQDETQAEGLGGFIEPEPSDWVEYMKPVNEYMYFRTQAVLNNDIDILWNQYPPLKENANQNLGVNVEKYEVETLNEGMDYIDANFNIESYERIKVKEINDREAIVLIHSSITYLGKDFNDSGGEFLIKVFLEQKDNYWTVVKTDEYTLPEYKEWVKDKKK